MTDGTQQSQAGRGVGLLIVGLFALLGFVLAALVIFADARSRGPIEAGTGAVRLAEPIGNTNRGNPPPVERPAPTFALTTLDGEPFSLEAMRGEVVFLNFWATWCGPCQREMPAFEAFMRERSDEATIVAVNAGDTDEAVREFITQYGGEGVPILMDRDLAVNDEYGVLNMPVTYIIDREGVIRFMKLGEMTEDDFDSYLAALAS